MNHLGHGLGMMLGAAGSSSSFTWTGCCWVHGLAPILALTASQASACSYLECPHIVTLALTIFYHSSLSCP